MIALPIRSRPLIQALTRPTPSLTSPTPNHDIQRRTFLGFFKSAGRDKKSTPGRGNNDLLTEDYLRRKSAEDQALPTRGELTTSIFDEEEAKRPSGPKGTVLPAPSPSKPKIRARNPANMVGVLDPDPASRMRWERKMVIRSIHKRGRLTRTQQLLRSERTCALKSHNIRTSVKKLQPLARQIAGKTVEEAIVQMRFSAKKASKDVLEHLEQARNTAVVARGMGLGPELEVPRRIEVAGGKRVTVKNETGLYVSQAWVGKGKHGKSALFRARGRVDQIQHPSTHIAVLLKEEKTRLRLHDEKVEKERRRKTWVQLPNRPINHQRPCYSW